MITFAISVLFAVTAIMVADVLITATRTAFGSYRQLHRALASLDDPQRIHITIEGTPHFAPAPQMRAPKMARACYPYFPAGAQPANCGLTGSVMARLGGGRPAI